MTRPHLIHWGDGVPDRLGALRAQGAILDQLSEVLGRLERHEALNDARFHDHALHGPLSGLRSVIVGHAPWMPPDQDRIVLVYQVRRRWLGIAWLDLHDESYRRATAWKRELEQ